MENYRVFYCANCGKPSIDRSINGCAKYCSKECMYLHHKGGVCKFNRGVNCDGGNCNNCGWNPEVEKKRKECLV